METISLEDLCANPERIFAEAAAAENGVIIDRGDQPAAVLMSLTAFNSIMETIHLLQFPANAAHIAKGMEELRSSIVAKHELTDD